MQKKNQRHSHNKIPVSRLMAEYIHARPAANAAAEQTAQKKRPLRNPICMAHCPFFICPHQKKCSHIHDLCSLSSASALYFVFITYHSSVAIQIEEYAPQIKPAISGSANSRMLATPNKNSINTMIKVVIEVLMLRESVCVKL